MRYTVNLDCKTHHISKDGTIPILLRVSINGSHDYFNTGRRIKIGHYDKENRSVRSGIKGHSSLTSFITRQKQRLDNIIGEFEKRNEVATLSKVKEIYDNETGKIKSDCFYAYVEEAIQWEKKHSSITGPTLTNYEVQLKKLRDYRPKLTIHDIDKKFLEKYKSHILETLGQANNTAYHAMCFLRKYTKKLFQEGKIRPYPFAEFQVGSPFEVEPEYLEPEELAKLHDLYDSKELLKIVKTARSKHARDFNIGVKYQEVLRYFLVACYTGLRHSDIKTLRREHIKGRFIVKQMVKGREGRKKTVRIPIRRRLYSLLEMNNPQGILFENPVMEDSQTNIYLKAIMKEARISKHITFHCARHTFSIISLLLGIKIEVVSDVLGHSELTTTQRYARVVDRLRDQEMDKWDKVAEGENSKTGCSVVCPTCDNCILTFERGVFRMNKIPIRCPYCSTSFNFDLRSNNDEKLSKIAKFLVSNR